MSELEIEQLIKECLEQNRAAQKAFYQLFYSFAMGICLRYSNNSNEAVVVMNKGFAKVFTGLSSYNRDYPFKAWLGQIMVNTSIDYYCNDLKIALSEDLDVDYMVNELSGASKLSHDNLLAIIHQLSPCYRIIFNLFVIEGYSHEQIAKLLNINPGVCESALYKARIQLKEIMLTIN